VGGNGFRQYWSVGYQFHNAGQIGIIGVGSDEYDRNFSVFEDAPDCLDTVWAITQIHIGQNQISLLADSEVDSAFGIAGHFANIEGQVAQHRLQIPGDEKLVFDNHDPRLAWDSHFRL